MNTKRTIQVQTKVKTEELSIECTARWLALMEAIYIVGKKADDMGINIDKNVSWIKPISFQKYMDERLPSMIHEIEMDLGIFKGGLERSDKLDAEIVEEEIESRG
jgi:hypothetical protein